jgi:hypothetical protein
MSAGGQDGSRREEEQAELAERYAATAVELLRQAMQRGYNDVANLQQNQDLDPLRPRADFRSLLSELEANTNPENR